jgi:hypothetical protein
LLYEAVPQGAPRHLNDGPQLDVLCGTQTAHGRDFVQRRGKEPRQASEAGEQIASELDCIPAYDAGATEDRKELRFGKDPGPVTQQPLARALILRPIGNAHSQAPVSCAVTY